MAQAGYRAGDGSHRASPRPRRAVHSYAASAGRGAVAPAGEGTAGGAWRTHRIHPLENSDSCRALRRRQRRTRRSEPTPSRTRGASRIGRCLAARALVARGTYSPPGPSHAYLALSTLLHLSDVPIVLGFDQLEGIARLGEDAVSLFLQALADQLYTGGGRALVVLFCQADVWQGFQKAKRRQVQ